MNGIIKHVFQPKKIIFDPVAEEPKVVEGEPITFYFSLLQQGHQIFEELYGQGIMAVIANTTVDTNKIASKTNNKVVQQKLLEKEAKNANASVMNLVTNSKFITCLAAASYLQIKEDGSIVNNIVTANTFLESEAVHGISNDIDFSQKMIQMITDSLPQEEVKKTKTVTPKKGKKK